jgi:hypothetical protein
MNTVVELLHQFFVPEVLERFLFGHGKELRQYL